MASRETLNDYPEKEYTPSGVEKGRAHFVSRDIVSSARKRAAAQKGGIRLAIWCEDFDVADPKLLKPVGAIIGGNRSDRVFETVVDFDATSLYPSIILATNIDASGQVGRLALPDPETGAFRDSSHLMTAWASGDFVEVGREWFGMPGTAELLSIVSNASQEVSA